MATMDPGQRGFGQQRQFNIPDLPFKDLDRQGPAGAGNAPFINQMQRLFPQGQMPPELLELLMAQLFGGQGGGRPPQRPPMGGGRPPMVAAGHRWVGHRWVAPSGAVSVHRWVAAGHP